ncbi:MAG: MarR family winged helix-turn-helix transcriptional regulator [Acidimicrobiia bacterium]|nr:MarR family winged helix-turn-helix transcriptional regulator [Acidimicrobiia bacterium]
MRHRSTSDGPAPTEGEVDAGPGNVLFDVWLVSRAVQALIDDAIKPIGLDADEFAVYSVLAVSGGLTPSSLAAWMAAPPTTVSSYVKRFERRGHVERLTNPDDGRSHILRLTSTGRAAHREAGSRYAPVLAEVEQHLGSEVGDVRRRLRELHRAADTTRGRT